MNSELIAFFARIAETERRQGLALDRDFDESYKPSVQSGEPELLGTDSIRGGIHA